MARKAGLTLPAVVDAAAAVADAEGVNAVSLARVARTLGVRAPSLYSYVDGLAGLRRAMCLAAGWKLVSVLGEVAQQRRGTDALRAMAHAYRRFATEHPGLYSCLLPVPTEEEDPEGYAAAGEVIALASGVLAQVGVPGDQAIAVIRSFRSGLHGFVTLEAGGGFSVPADVDQCFETLVDILIAGVLSHSGTGGATEETMGRILA